MLCLESAPAHLRSLQLDALTSTQADGDEPARLPLTKVNFHNIYDGAVEVLSLHPRMPLRINSMGAPSRSQAP